MDIALRILHIVSGVYVAGMYIFTTLILLPRLHALGPTIERPVLRSVLGVASPVNAVSAIILLGTGVAMALRLRGGSLDMYFGTGWGLIMVIAAICAAVAIVLGFAFLMPLGLRMDKLYRTIEGRKPTSDEAHQLEQFIARFRAVERVNFALIMVALVAMPITRFV